MYCYSTYKNKITGNKILLQYEYIKNGISFIKTRSNNEFVKDKPLTMVEFSNIIINILNNTTKYKLPLILFVIDNKNKPTVVHIFNYNELPEEAKEICEKEGL
jgi:hypothetical protein